MTTIESNLTANKPKQLKCVLNSTISLIEERSRFTGQLAGLPSSLTDLDSITAGFQNSDLIIIGGRPGMGKTTLAMNIVDHVSSIQDKPVLVFSLAMPAEKLTMKILSSYGYIDQTRIRTGKLEQSHWHSLIETHKLLQERPIYIDDSAAINPSYIHNQAHQLAEEYGGIGLIVIDDLQSIDATGLSKCHSLKTTEITKSMKQLAKQLNCPVILLSQVSRRIEQRVNHRPICSDLRESGSIEQYADLIMFIYRDEVYHSESPDKGKAEIIIAKQRTGLTGTVRVGFDGKYSRFVDIIK